MAADQEEISAGPGKAMKRTSEGARSELVNTRCSIKLSTRMAALLAITMATIASIRRAWRVIQRDVLRDTPVPRSYVFMEI